MDDVVPIGAKPVDDPLGHTRVREESQSFKLPCLRDVDFFLSQPRSIFNCLANVFWFEIRVHAGQPIGRIFMPWTAKCAWAPLIRLGPGRAPSR